MMLPTPMRLTDWLKAAYTGERFVYFAGLTPEEKPPIFDIVSEAVGTGRFTTMQRKTARHKDANSQPLHDFDYIIQRKHT